MTQSQIFSKLSRLGLLSVFCAGLFLLSGELSISTDGIIQIGNGGIYTTFAAETPPVTPASDKTDATINAIISVFNLLIGTLGFLITPLIMLAGWLLSPDWTFGDIFNLRTAFHSLWVLVSNVVYVVFGFMLVFVAFANIFGGKAAEAYQMKTYLPKLLTGMLIVPFTWFIVSAVLSVANVLTASVIQLPYSTLKLNPVTSGFLSNPIVPKTVYYIKGADFGTGSANGVINNGEFAMSDCAGGKENCLSIEDILSGGGGGAYNLLSVYAYGIVKIQDFKAITIEQGIKNIADIAIKLIFGGIFFIVFGILVIAIVYALLTRVFMLWLYAIFSPIFALMFVLGKSEKFKALENFEITKFISLAMVPVYVSAALAFGLMFLGAVMNAGDDTGKIQSSNVEIDSPGEGVTSFTVGSGDRKMQFVTSGILDSSTIQTAGAAAKASKKTFNTGASILGTIILNIIALVILWMSVMAALNSNDITKAAVEPITSMGTSIGGLMKNAPSYTPIPGMSGQSMGSIAQGSKQTVDFYGSQAMQAKAGEFSKQFTDKNYGEAVAHANKMGVAGANNQWGIFKTELHEALSKTGGTTGAAGNAIFRDQIAGVGTKMDIKIDGQLVTAEMLKDPKKMAQIIGLMDEKMRNEAGKYAHTDLVDGLNKSAGGIYTVSEIDSGTQGKDGGKEGNNITITSNEKGTPGDYNIIINGKTGTFDIALDVNKNAKNLEKLKGEMTEGEFETEMIKHNMEVDKVKALITQLRKTSGFFKS